MSIDLVRTQDCSLFLKIKEDLYHVILPDAMICLVVFKIILIAVNCYQRLNHERRGIIKNII